MYEKLNCRSSGFGNSILFVSKLMGIECHSHNVIHIHMKRKVGKSLWYARNIKTQHRADNNKTFLLLIKFIGRVLQQTYSLSHRSASYALAILAGILVSPFLIFYNRNIIIHIFIFNYIVKS